MSLKFAYAASCFSSTSLVSVPAALSSAGESGDRANVFFVIMCKLKVLAGGAIVEVLPPAGAPVVVGVGVPSFLCCYYC